MPGKDLSPAGVQESVADEDDPTHRRAPRRSRLFHAVAAGLFLVFSLGVALGLGELAVRLAAPQQLILKRPDIWMSADTLGWTHRPNVNTTLNTAERTVRFVTDERGYRVSPGIRPDYGARILLLGDSFMEALQVEYEESLAGLLESRPGVSGGPVLVRNTAVGGWDPPQYLLQARRSLSQERFDLVIVSLFLGNDIVKQQLERIAPRVPTEVHHLRLPRQMSWDELVDAWLYPINDALEVRSHLFVLLKNQSQTLRMKMGLSAAYFPDQFRRREVESPRWRVTADICRGIADLADSYGVPIIFLLLPTSYQVDADAFSRYLLGFNIDPAGVDLDQPNRLLGQAMEARGLIVLDPLDTLRREHEKGVRLYGRVDTHFNANGHRVVDHFIEPTVGSYVDRDTHQP